MSQIEAQAIGSGLRGTFSYCQGNSQTGDHRQQTEAGQTSLLPKSLQRALLCDVVAEVADDTKFSVWFDKCQALT